MKKSLAAQDVPWPTDSSGNPVGNGCLECKHLVVRLWTDLAFVDAAVRINAKSAEGQSMSKQLDAGRIIYQSLKESAIPEVVMRRPGDQVSSTSDLGGSA